MHIPRTRLVWGAENICTQALLLLDTPAFNYQLYTGAFCLGALRARNTAIRSARCKQTHLLPHYAAALFLAELLLLFRVRRSGQNL